MAINDLAREIGELTKTIAPSLLALFGCGSLTAAKLFAETAGIGRFRSRAAYASHTGTAPIPVWSGNLVRHRLSRGGNRQLNAGLHRIAITQLPVVQVSGRLTLLNGLPPATRRPRPSASFVDDSATKSSADCRPMRLLEPAWKASFSPLLDTGAMDSVRVAAWIDSLARHDHGRTGATG